MITMDMLGKVRRMKMRDKLTIREISKRTGLARNTVKRWLKAPGDVSPRYLRRSDATKLSAYEAVIVPKNHSPLDELTHGVLKLLATD
jgi:transposase